MSQPSGRAHAESSCVTAGALIVATLPPVANPPEPHRSGRHLIISSSQQLIISSSHHLISSSAHQLISFREAA